VDADRDLDAVGELHLHEKVRDVRLDRGDARRVALVGQASGRGVSPSIRGMRMSISTMSGRVKAITSRPSAPSPA
jgi:hypothetical protein